MRLPSFCKLLLQGVSAARVGRFVDFVVVCLGLTVTNMSVF